MFWQRWWLAAGLSVALVLEVQSARADVPTACRSIDRGNLVRCVLAASSTKKAGVAEVEAAEGRASAEDPWFPSAPIVALTGARRTAPGQEALNWSASLGVELGLSGQSGASRKAALAERDAGQRGVEALSRAAAGDAFRLYFEILGGREARELAERFEAVSKRVWDAARAGAERGALPGVEADLAEAAYVRVVQRRIDARRDEERARGELAAMLGATRSADVSVTGTLAPLAGADRVDPDRVPQAPEASVLEAESRAFEARAEAKRRGRVPNPTLSVFAQRDAFDEKVIGLGLAFPLPLPEPLGRMSSGEIAENEALARRARFLADDSRKQAKAALLRALANHRAALEASRTYTSDRLTRAEATLANLAFQVESARLGARDAVLLQEPLFELLSGAVEAKKALCVASVELARAAGAKLEEGGGR
jgi:cobalt-zinc-cadmium efflux system outer membrane protein